MENAAQMVFNSDYFYKFLTVFERKNTKTILEKTLTFSLDKNKMYIPTQVFSVHNNDDKET